MGTVTMTKTFECADGTHFRINVTGDVTGVVSIYGPDMTNPVTDEEAEIFFRLLLKLARKGRTANQFRTAITNGLTVNA